MENIRFATRCDKYQLEKIKKLLHEKKPYGMTNIEFLIKLLEEVKK